jgi:hypothetical protein
MSLQRWNELIASAPSDGSALASSAALTSIVPVTAKPIIRANDISVGKVLRVTAAGRISNIVTAPGNITFQLSLGGINIASSGALNLNVVAKTNVSWFLTWLLTCRQIGAAANLMHQGFWQSESVIGSPVNSAGGNGSLNFPVSAPAVGGNFDSTVDNALDLLAQFSVNNAGNSIQLHQFGAELVN